MRVSILAFDGCLGAEVFGLADLLLIANRIGAGRGGPAPFEVRVVSVGGGSVDAAGGVRLATRRPAPTDLLVVPAFDLEGGGALDRVLARLAPEVAFLAREGVRTPVAAICGGAFLLAGAGLLDGRRCTTAWAFAAELARRHPSARVEAEALLVRDGPVTTSGAFSAGHDLALQLIREHASDGLARAVARFTLLDGERDSQAPYIDVRMLERARAPFARRVTRWLELRLAEPYSLERLAAAFHVSERTLSRRFKAETGRTPLEQLQDLRVAQARRLLETTGLSLAEVAGQVGYLDVSTFARLFSRRVRVTPAAYRRRLRLRSASDCEGEGVS
jgi:transcriptional regulator GlxA family with amidase domain